ncbi:hypothetical protein L873DRAFT_1844405 [Choiromyces venosus 120613-1]|uniref:Uncharacterized protein n=1 Tax=Choiromyces venosus 120613-1 TaxID=1336337 RepID=A0A3N4JQ03_9PEZI|nr:hypothetical protein L873DRAFT_1844405 [Choiromyces venosus 120613-1]
MRLRSHVMGCSGHVVCCDGSPELNTVKALSFGQSKCIFNPFPLHLILVLGPQAQISGDVLFNSISAVTHHIESGQCEVKLSAADFHNPINYENNLLGNNDLFAKILARTITTHTKRAGILPPRVNAALADIPDGCTAEEFVPKDRVSILDHTLPAKPTSRLSKTPERTGMRGLGPMFVPTPSARRCPLVLLLLKPIMRISLSKRCLLGNTPYSIYSRELINRVIQLILLHRNTRTISTFTNPTPSLYSCYPETDSGSNSEDMYVDEKDLQFLNKRNASNLEMIKGLGL